MKQPEEESTDPEKNSSCDPIKPVSDGAPPQKDSVCTLCLGLLQNEFNSQQFIDKFQKIVTEANYEFSTFSIALSLPVTIFLREHALLIALRERYKAIYYGRGKESICPIKDVWKWLHCEGLSEFFKAQSVQARAESPFEISLNFDHANVEKECSFLYDLFPNIFVKRKQNKHGWETFARMTVLKALEGISDAKFQKHYQCPPRPLDTTCRLQSITCTNDAIYVAGRYNKYTRELPQTPWIINGERKAESSIEEYICSKLSNFFIPKECKFSSSGREDIDVLMLGTGRPFCVEIINPHKVNTTEEIMCRLESEINSSTSRIQVRDLQVVTKDATNIMKEGETEKTKIYCALCWSESEITQERLDATFKPIKDLILKQKTPVRVLHRRPLATRDRTVYTTRAELIDKHHFKLHLSTQAGTYIKEFVHGDFGRTKPNVSMLLGNECDILELDVEGVELDWPPTLYRSNASVSVSTQ